MSAKDLKPINSVIEKVPISPCVVGFQNKSDNNQISKKTNARKGPKMRNLSSSELRNKLLKEVNSVNEKLCTVDNILISIKGSIQDIFKYINDDVNEDEEDEDDNSFPSEV